MGELLWRCDEGASFSSEASGLQLEVVRAPFGDGFRYQLLRGQGPQQPASLVASGHCRELRDAIAAAERMARSFAPAGRSFGPANAFAPRDGKAA